MALPILNQLGNFWSYLNQSSSNVGEISSATAHKYAVGSVPVPSRTPVPGPVENYIPGPVENLPDFIYGPVMNFKN